MHRIVCLVPLMLPLAAPAAAPAAPPPHWKPHVGAARAYAAARAGDVSFAVRTERRAWSWRGTTPYRSASVVKAMLLVAYLRRGDVRDRALRSEERALLDPMVRSSDNRAATTIHARVGLEALSALGRRAGMRHFVPHPVWGGSTITADDQARLFLRIDRLVPRRHRTYAMGLLRGVIPAQRWGIAKAVPDGWRIAFKGGWGRGVTRQVEHQAALLTSHGQRVSVAVLTADNPSDGYGAATQEGVARRLLRGLGAGALGTLVPFRGMLRRNRSKRYASCSMGSTSTPEARLLGVARERRRAHHRAGRAAARERATEAEPVADPKQVERSVSNSRSARASRRCWSRSVRGVAVVMPRRYGPAAVPHPSSEPSTSSATMTA